MQPAPIPYEGDESESPEERAQWEKNRKKECFLDLYAYARRVAFGTALGAAVLAPVAWLVSGATNLLQFFTVVIATAIVGGALTIWLRFWGSYIEKRLCQIEQRINDAVAELSRGTR